MSGPVSIDWVVPAVQAVTIAALAAAATTGVLLAHASIRRLWYRIEHRIHYWHHIDAHTESCTCHGTGRFT